jgi:hypothetical protein
MMDMKQNKTYYPNIRTEMRNGQWAYWQQVNPNKGWVFKFHDNFAGQIPPFLGLFIDAIDFDTVQKLQESKSALDTYKMIFGTIPRHKDGSNKSGNSKDDFAIDPKTLSSYMKLIKGGLPDGIDFKAAPLDNVQLFEFASNVNEDAVGNTIKNFYQKSGAEKALFGSEKPNASTMKASLQNDGDFVTRLYNQFSTFCNYHLSKVTKQYKFKIIFEGTSYDKDERRANALEEWQSGILTPRLPAIMVMSVRDFKNSVVFMQSLGFPENLKPLLTSFTATKEDSKDGRPEDKKANSESKDVANDYNTNENKSEE